MAVKIGSARSSFGNTTAGDQNGGKEVSMQDWYLHSKGWVVYRAKDRAVRAKIAEAMEKACANDQIGYSQGSRNTLYNNIKDKDFDPSQTTKAVNTDCSALVRVCCAYAGIKVDDFITSSEGKTLMNSGCFEKLTDEKYTKQSDYLMKGDILCTKTKGHTVVVLTDGRKAEYPAEESTDGPAEGTLALKNGKWNLRAGPGTKFASLGTVKNGDPIVQVDTNGWLYVWDGERYGWLSPNVVKK